MSPAVRLGFKKLILWAAPLAALACGGDGGTDVVLPSLRITTATTGIEADPDGYAISIDGQAAQPIGPNASLTVDRLPEGQHTIELSGVAANCAVGGENPRPVSVAPGATVSLAFVIACSAGVGSVQVVTTTSGTGTDPDGFSLLLDSADRGPIAVSATSILAGLTPGSHTVGLTGLAANCQLSGDNPRAITVPAGGTAQVAFAVVCTATGPTTGNVEVVTVTSGSGTDPDGFSLLLDGADRGTIAVSATSRLAGLTPGSHTIGLTGLAGNCLVTGENPRAITVPAGGTAQVAFAVSCTAPGPTAGSLGISTATTGPAQDADGYLVSVDGGTSQPIGTNATVSLANVSAAQHTVQLLGLAANCQVSGNNPRAVTVTAGGTAQVAFAIVCAATGPTTGNLVVSTVTTGPAQDADGYLVSVDGRTGQPIGTTATLTLPNVPAAQHTVELLGLAPNCGITGDNPIGVGIEAGETARVGFTVTCAATAGTLTVTVQGLPNGVAAAVTVAGPNDFSRLLTETGTLTGLTPGSYAVSAADVDNGGTTYTASVGRPTVPVTAGATATVTVSYSPAVVDPTLNLRIDGLYITQSTQTYTSSVPLVAGRAAYLRVFVVANETNTARPSVRVQLSRPGAAPQTLTITAPAGQTPTRVQEGTLGSSWNVEIPAPMIQPGLTVSAELDPEKDIDEADEDDNLFPASGTKALTVRSVPTARIRFVSVQQGSSPPGNISNPSQLIELARRMHPLSAVEVDVRAGVFTASEPLQADGSGWDQVLGDLDAMRLADPDGEQRIYFGLARLSYGRDQGIVGNAFTGIPGATTALGWDDAGDASRVVAHELGHIWGRRHAPCGNPPAGTVDGLYPHPGGQIGVYGMDVPQGALKAPTSPDIMGYCFQDPWISDYTYRGVMSYRQSNVAPAGISAMPRRSLLVWGRIVNGQPVLEPSFEIVTRPSLPKRPGPYSVSATGADGSRLFSLSFDVAAVEDNPAGNGHFAFAVPLDGASASRLGNIRLQGPTGSVANSRVLAQLRARPSSESIEARRQGGNVALSWDAAVHPMIMVRDPDTGEVLSFARGGTALLRTDKGELDLVVSDGVRSHRTRADVR